MAFDWNSPNTFVTLQNVGNGVATVGTPGPPSPTPSLSQLEQALRYTRCMREHGVPMLDPDANGDVRGADSSKGELDGATVDSAQQACRQYRSG